MPELIADIPLYATFTAIEPLNKGWSSDKKYRVETAGGGRFLLRLADISEYEHKKAEFENMRRVAASGIPMQQPVLFGICSSGKSVYLLLTWVDGEDLQEVLPLLSKTEQYALGLEAGKILKKMHTLYTTSPSDDWLNGYGAKLDNYIRNYQNCDYTFEGDSILIEYLQNNRHLLGKRPLCLTHDDYHPGNMIFTADKKLSLIDFQRLRMVEPFHAFSGLCFPAKYSPRFATGQIHGYFDGEPPTDFWRLLSLYMAAIAVNNLPWSVPYGQGEIDFAYEQIADILRWYDNFTRLVPSWYPRDHTFNEAVIS
ncbi:MAG: phosphotransferase [Oscillospiraceae bacterium]|jgi:serine/threonine-protein kinase|nr:phosphotransferase [Oscillospiraceae bacterium]